MSDFCNYPVAECKMIDRIRELENALQNLLGVMGMQAHGVLREDILDDTLRQCRRALYPPQEKDR